MENKYSEMFKKNHVWLAKHPRNRIRIYEELSNEVNTYIPERVLFFGECKSINELRTIEKLLNI